MMPIILHNLDILTQNWAHYKSDARDESCSTNADYRKKRKRTHMNRRKDEALSRGRTSKAWFSYDAKHCSFKYAIFLQQEQRRSWEITRKIASCESSLIHHTKDRTHRLSEAYFLLVWQPCYVASNICPSPILYSRYCISNTSGCNLVPCEYIWSRVLATLL